jgi:chromosome segregation ATPase
MSETKISTTARPTPESPAFWRNWRAAFTNPPKADEGANAVILQPLAPDFNVMASVNEDIRERCLNVIHRTEEILSLRQDFVGIFGEVEKILHQAELTSTALVERTALLRREEEAGSALKALHASLQEESERHLNENALLKSEVERFGMLVGARESRINALEGELAKERASSALLRSELDQERAAHSAAAERLADALVEMETLSATVAGQHLRIAELSDQNSLTEFQNVALERTFAEAQGVTKGVREQLVESQKQVESLTTDVGEANREIEALRGQAKIAEAAMAASKLDHEIGQAVWLEKGQAASEEIERLKAEASSERARADANETQLAATRAEVQTTAAMLRAKEREAEQLSAKLDPLTSRVRSSTDEITTLAERLAESEKSRAALADRAHAMVRAMADIKTKHELADERSQQLESRLAVEAVRSAANTEQLEIKIRTLIEELEKEKAAHLVAMSSLEAARGRIIRQHGSETLLDILSRPESENADVGIGKPSSLVEDVETAPDARPKLQNRRRNGIGAPARREAQ